VDFAKKQAVVTVETEKYDEKALVNALEKEGFGGKVVVAGQARGMEVAALGADTRVPTAEEAKTYDLGTLVGRVQGQYVSSVEKGGPADKAGLKPGDVLLVLDANKLYSRDDVEDFLGVSKPGAPVKVVVKRAETYKEETVTLTLGANKVEGKDKHFPWQYAGLGQFDAAVAAAKKEGKVVLVGLSGADT
jgi:S1-C subfamily serine protease